MGALVLYSLNEMLPNHHQWQFKSAATRWELSAAMLKVWWLVLVVCYLIMIRLVEIRRTSAFLTVITVPP